MKVSEITVKDLSTYLMVDETTELDHMLTATKAYIRSYTGLTDEAIDTHDDITHAVYILVSDMYDNRALMVTKNYVNKSVSCILNMHCTNLI